MATSDIETTLQTADLTIEAANDALSAFATKGASAGQLLNLIPGLIALSSNFKELPTELKHLNEDDLNAVVQRYADGLKLPEGKAKDIGTAVFPVIFATIGVLEKLKGLSDIIAGHKPDLPGADAPVVPPAPTTDTPSTDAPQ